MNEARQKRLQALCVRMQAEIQGWEELCTAIIKWRAEMTRLFDAASELVEQFRETKAEVKRLMHDVDDDWLRDADWWKQGGQDDD